MGLVPFRHYSTVIERMFNDVVAFFLFVFDALLVVSYIMQ